ncbi:MAG: hypothetical protein R3C28_33820 [Pirellulaceae bacterium]
MSANLPSSPIAFQRSQNPRLSIFHLLLFTSVTATLFAIARPMLGDTSTAMNVVLGVFLLFQSAQFFAAFVVACWLFRNDTKPIAPGEWMVLAAVGQLLGRLFPVSIPIGAIILLIAIATRRIMPLWSIAFGLMAVALSVPFTAGLIFAYGSQTPQATTNWLALVGSIFLAILSYFFLFKACRRDWQRGYRGGWLHWLGLGLALPTLTFGSNFLLLLLFQLSSLVGSQT